MHFDDIDIPDTLIRAAQKGQLVIFAGAGVSKQEVFNRSKVIPISDEGCTLDDKNHIVWDTEEARPPIWSEKIYY